MPTVSTGSDAYQDLETIRRRIDYDGSEFFNDNEQLRFDKLLVRLEKESRGIFETLWGDETPLEETGRTDTKRATDDAAMLLAYPVQDVTKVETKRSGKDDWDTLDEHRYTHSEHRLILEARRRGLARGNELAHNTLRATWRDIASRVRVTYDRGFSGGAPNDVKSIQISLINRMLRQLRGEQNIAAASPDELAGVSPDFDAVVTDEIRSRIADVTKPGGATLSV